MIDSCIFLLMLRPSALSFWQYQIHQENSYQQSVLKYANEKNAQLQKQLDNVIREGTRASPVPLSPFLTSDPKS